MIDGIQFIGRVFAGFPSPAKDYQEEDLDLAAYLRRGQTSVYLARVEGDSMSGANIPDGAMVVIDKALKAKNKSIIIASVDGVNIIKQLRRSKEGWMLASANARYAPVAIDKAAQIEIWGVVTHVIVNLINIK